MSPSPYDLAATTADLFESEVTTTVLRAGDVLLIRPTQPIGLAEMSRATEMLDQRLGPCGVNAVVIPHEWEVLVARPVAAQEVLDGLEEILRET